MTKLYGSKYYDQYWVEAQQSYIDWNGNTISKPKKAYTFVIGNCVVPWTPSSATVKNSDNTEIVSLANDTYVTIPHRDSPQSFSFEFRMPADGSTYPYMLGEGSTYPKAWSDYLWLLKALKRTTTLSIWRTGNVFSMVEPVILTDFSYTEDAEKGDDFTFSVSFVTLHEQQNQELSALDTHGLILTKNARGWNRGSSQPTSDLSIGDAATWTGPNLESMYQQNATNAQVQNVPVVELAPGTTVTTTTVTEYQIIDLPIDLAPTWIPG